MLPDALFLNVHMYGIMIAVGLLFAFLVLFLYGKKKKIDEKLIDFIFYDGIISILLGFAAATLFQSVYNYLEHPERGFHLGGMTFIGGLVGGAAVFLGVYFLTAGNFRKNIPGTLSDVLPILPCCITVAHGFGRIGCFFAGCCYGKETDCFLGIKFPNLPNPVHPTQLYEAAFLFLLFGLLSYLVLKKNFQHTLGLYLIAYGVFRFAIEFIRGDDRGKFIGALSPSQFWSIFMIAIGIFLIFALPRIMTAWAEKKKNDGEK